MNRTVTVDGFTLAIEPATFLPGGVVCFINAPDGQVVGWGAAMSTTDAINDAVRAWNTTRRATVDKLRQALAATQPVV